MRAPGETGASSRARHEATTPGVRAQQVGAKLASRAIVRRGAGERKLPGPWPVNPRPGSRRTTLSLRVHGQAVAIPPGPSPRGQPCGQGWGSRDLPHALADCFDCRSRRATLGPRRTRGGLAPRSRRGDSSWQCGAKARRKPVRGGEAVGTVAGSREGALGDGRRSDPAKAPALTSGCGSRVWLAAKLGFGPADTARDRGRQR
jgi:hypothetical protein